MATTAGEEKIFVSVRLRPLNEKEISRNDVSDWECINDNTIIFRNNLPVPDRSMYPTAYTFGRGSSYPKLSDISNISLGISSIKVLS